jgi:hypothetical protein
LTTDAVVKVLAVVGGGVLGGLGLGLLAQLLARAFTTKKLPRWPRLVVQLLGGGICAWLVALWLFGGGGGGIGGTGGWGFGSGPGKGDGEKTTEVARKDSDSTKTSGEAVVPAADTLRIEVLGRAVLPKEDIDMQRWYRIDTEEKPRLMTFAEVKETVNGRQKKQPPLRRIAIVLYNDSPAEDVAVVSQLVAWGRDLNDGKMKLDISKRDADAPRK